MIEKDKFINAQYSAPVGWHKGDEATTPEFYSAIRKAKEIDPEKSAEAAKAFGAWQNNPANEYYSPYLYNMTNTTVANNIADIGYELGMNIDISKGVTREDIDTLSQFADWTGNLGINGTPNNSGTPAQRLAYNLYQLYKDEEVTEQAEAEMLDMQNDINALVNKGYSDDFIFKYVSERYPTLQQLTETAKQHMATPVNRALGYSDDYAKGVIWAAYNGGTSGNNINDIANYQDKVGKMYEPDAEAEAARDPSSDNYHPYAQGATLDWLDFSTYPESGVYDQAWLDSNVGMLNGTKDEADAYRKVKSAYLNTENAKTQLASLQNVAKNYLANGKTPEEVYTYFTKNGMENMQENYPTLVKMENARQNGTYISLTDSVDFALPYFEKWIYEQAGQKMPSNSEDAAEQLLSDEAAKKAAIDNSVLRVGKTIASGGKIIGNKAVSNTEEETSFSAPEKEMNEETIKETAEKNLASADKMASEVLNDGEKTANAPDSGTSESTVPAEDTEADAVSAEEEAVADTAPQSFEELYPIVQMNEVAVAPAQNFDATAYLQEGAKSTPEYQSLIDDIWDIRRGAEPSNPEAAALYEKFAYLFGGETHNIGYQSDTIYDSRKKNISESGKRYVSTPIDNTSFYTLLVAADEAQKNGAITQLEYSEMLVGMAGYIQDAENRGVSLKDELSKEDVVASPGDKYFNPNGTATGFVNQWNLKIENGNLRINAERKEERIQYAKNSGYVFDLIDAGQLPREISDEQAQELGITQNEVNSFYHAYDEMYTMEMSTKDIERIDPGGFYTQQQRLGIDDDIQIAIDNNEFMKKIADQNNGYDPFSVDNMMRSAESFIRSRIESAYIMDARKAITFGCSLEEYYNALGVYKYNFSEYKEAVVNQAIQDFEVFSTLLDDDIADIYIEMAGFETDGLDMEYWKNELIEEAQTEEEKQKISDAYNNDRTFTDEEIEGAVREGVISEEEAEKLKTYEKALRQWLGTQNYTETDIYEGMLEDENTEKLNKYLHGHLLNYYAGIAQKANDALVSGATPETILKIEKIEKIENYGEGVSAKIVIGSATELGFKQHGLKWTETWYALTRKDSQENEANLRTMYSRPEARKNIENAIKSLQDEATRNYYLKEYYEHDGDIYDFFLDIDTVSVQNSIANQQENINFLQEEMKSVMTEGQYKTATTMASATNSLLFSGESVVVTTALTALGLPHGAALFCGALATTGLTTMGETVNAGMDANPEADKGKLVLGSLPAMFANSALESLFDINIGGMKLNVGGNTLSKSVKSFVQDRASNGLMKALMHKGGEMATKLATEVLALATDQAMEVGQEIAQDAITNTTKNVMYARAGRYDLIDEMTWDEISDLMGDTLQSGIVQWAVGGLFRAPKRIASSWNQQRQKNNAIINEMAKQEKLNGAQVKAVEEALTNLANAPDSVSAVEVAAHQSEVDKRTAEILTSQKEEIMSTPEAQARETANEKLSEAQAEQNAASETVAQATEAVNAANEQLQSEEVPSAETIQAVEEAQTKLNEANEQYNAATENVNTANAEAKTAEEAFTKVKKSFYEAAKSAAKTEIRGKIKEMKAAERQAAIEAYKEEYDKLYNKEKERFIEELMDEGYSEQKIEKFNEKAQQRIESWAKKEATAKDELLRLFQQKLPAYKVMYKMDTGDAAGWVVRQGGEGTLVLNPNFDYDTLAGALSAHELVHVAEDSAVYNDLVDVVKELYFAGDENKFNSAKTALNKDLTENEGRTLSDAEAGKEVIAEAVQDMFSGRGEWVKQIVAEKPNLAQRMFEWVKSKVDEFKLRRKETKDGKNEEEVNEAVKTYRQYVKIRRLLRDALSEAGKKITTDTVQDTVRKAGEKVMNRTRDFLHPEPNVQTETTTEVSETTTAAEETTTATEDNSTPVEETTTVSEMKEVETPTAKGATVPKAVVKDDAIETEEVKTEDVKKSPETRNAELARKRYPKLFKELEKYAVDVAGYSDINTYAVDNGFANADELVEYEAQFDYDDYNTEEENAIIEEANKDAEEYMSVTENEELTDKAKTAAEEEATVAEEADVADTKADVADTEEEGAYSEKQLVPQGEVEGNWIDYFTKERGEDLNTGHQIAEAFGFDGTWDFLSTVVMYPVKWFKEFGLENFKTADDFKQAAEKIHQKFFDQTGVDLVFDSEGGIDLADVENAMKTTPENGTTDVETDTLLSSPAFEFASKRRIEAAEKARKAARLLRDSAYFRETGDWTNYQKSLMQRMGLGEINKKLNTPDAILKGLASELGIGVYTGTIANGKHFAAYDARASSLISDNKAAASDYATFMYSIGEKLKKIAGITDPSEDYALGDFMFDYMLQKDADFSAATRAYAKEFREKLKAAGSDFAQAIENARDKLQTFKNASAVERVNAFLVSRADKKKEGIGAQLRKLTIGLVDQTLAAEIVDETTGSHALREAAAYLPYARRRVERNIEGDTFVDADGNRTGGYTLKTALADIKENELEAFETYLFAREAIDRYEMGKAPFVVGDPASITLSEAKKTVETLVKQHPNFKKAGAKYNQFWDNFMQTYVVNEGFLSQEDYNRMSEAHPNYVSFAREHTKKYGIYGAKGNSNNKVYYPLENAIAMINQFTNRAMQNRFARVFDELYQANDDLGFIAEQLPLTVESMIKVVPDGITAPDELMKELAGAFADKDKTEVAANSNNGTKLTVVRQDGTRVTYDIQDKPLFDLLSGSSVYNQIQGLEIGEKVRKAVAFVTSTMAKLTTGSNPLFMVRNFARDFQKSVNYGSWASNYITGLLKMIKGLPEYAFKLTEKAKDFDALGGGEWERLNVNTTKGVKQFKKSLFDRKFKELSAAEKAKRIVLSPIRVPLKVVDWFGTNTEAGMRYMEYAYGKHDLSTAKGRQEAFMASMESTVDFQRSGNQSRWLKAIVPFANATLQGNYQNLRMFTDAEKSRLGARLTKMILNNALLGAIETIINVHWGRNEEDREKYLKMQLETKQKYFMIPLDDEAEREFAAIPISQDWLSRICFEFGRKAALGEYEEEDGFAKDIATLAFGLVTEMVTETTTIASPFFDVLQNENYYGIPIVKQSLEDYLPEARYDTTTADAFKSASNLLARGARRIGISADSKLSRLVTPLALEYFAEQYTGVFGQLIIPSISFNKYTGKMGGLKAFGNVVRNRFTLDADSYNVITDRFYDICDTVTQMQKHIDSGRAYTLNPDLTEEEVSILFDEVADSDNKGGAIYEAKAISKECENEIGRIMLRNDLTDHEKNVLVEEQHEIRNAAFMNVIAWFDPIQMQLEGNAPRLVSKRDPVEKRISNLPEAFKVDYDNGKAYMIEAERLARLPENSSKTTILPKPNMQPTRTINGISYEYDLENDERFKDLAEEYKERYYGDEFEGFGVYANGIISDPKYENDYSDEEKTAAFQKAGKNANELAKEWLWEQIDSMVEDEENGIEKYEGMTKGKVK